LRGVKFENEKEAEDFLLADNRLSEIGGWNKDLLDEMLVDMEEIRLEGTGFNIADVPELDELGNIPEPGTRKYSKLKACPKCGFEFDTEKRYYKG
jgi:hypothetical protein